MYAVFIQHLGKSNGNQYCIYKVPILMTEHLNFTYLFRGEVSVFILIYSASFGLTSMNYKIL